MSRYAYNISALAKLFHLTKSEL